MNLQKPETITIPTENPFQNDQLNRKENIEVLTNLLKAIQGPFVFTINSPWGTGKTTFVKMWEKHLTQNNDFHCLYFNAWENDFATDPLIAFIGEIQSEIIKKQTENNSKVQQYFDKTKKVGASIAKKSIPALIKLATYGVLDLTNENVLADLAQDIVKSEIENYEKNKNLLQEFRDSLKDFVVELSRTEDETPNDKCKPLVFFIDELDRCRPNYAIELLERIKHLFNVPNIIFVLVWDKEQLGHSIRSLYGLGMDVDGYLRKFVDLEYQLPEASTADFSKHLFLKYDLNSLFNKTGQPTARQFFDMFVELANMFRFNLRKIEHCFTQIYIVLQAIPQNSLVFPDLLAFLIVLKNTDSILYNQYIKKQIQPEHIIKIIQEKPKGDEFIKKYYTLELDILCAFKDYQEFQRFLAQKQEQLGNTNINDFERKKLEKHISHLNHIGFYDRFNLGHYLIKKIEILDQFKI